MKLPKTCPKTRETIETIILTWPNNNTGTIVVCKEGVLNDSCPEGRKYICQFPLNPERREAICTI